MKVLVSAYACEPGKGSEPGVGWNWVCQIARFHEVWVITRASNREAIEAALVERPMPNVHWNYFDLPHWARFWKKGNRGVHLYYYLWQAGVYWVARKLLQDVQFDLVHHVTIANYWMPSYLALLPPPFVLGPVGGGESAPSAFWFSFSTYGKLYETFRSLARRLGQLDPFVRLAARRAALVLATTDQTEERIRALDCRRIVRQSQGALPSEEIEQLGRIPPRSSSPFRVVSIGNLLHLKGFELGLEAFAQFLHEFPASEYWLIGGGKERNRLERVARKLGVSGKVTFWGFLPRPAALAKLAECDVLMHPALHDSSGWASLEAMAAGRPVICLDLGGPALQVTEQTGIKVPAISPRQVVGDLAAALTQLARNPAARLRLGRAAQLRVRETLTWDYKGEWINSIYLETKSASK